VDPCLHRESWPQSHALSLGALPGSGIPRLDHSRETGKHKAGLAERRIAAGIDDREFGFLPRLPSPGRVTGD